MKVKGQIDSIEVNFVIDIPKSLFLYQKDKDLVSKISRKIKETSLDITELMYRLRGDLFDFEKHYESIKDVSITYICFQCKLHNKYKLCQRCGSVKGFTTVEHIICPNCNESTHSIIGGKMMKFCNKCGFIINDIKDEFVGEKELPKHENGLNHVHGINSETSVSDSKLYEPLINSDLETVFPKEKNKSKDTIVIEYNVKKILKEKDINNFIKELMEKDTNDRTDKN